MIDKVKDANTDKLAEAIVSVRSVDEAYRFLSDLCTISEITEMSKRLTAAEMLRDGNTYNEIAEKTHLSTATITRVNRAGIDLLPSRKLRLQLGDKLTIVGEARAVENVSVILGNESKQLKNPNLLSLFIGIVLGLILGSIPIMIPGISTPIKLGIAGGPIIVGILMGAFGPRFHIATYTTRSANLMLRQLGLTIYLAGLGLSAGAGFFATVFTMEGLKWVLVSIALCVIPVLAIGFIAARIFKMDYADNIGMLCGGMANPFALDYAGTGSDGDDPAVAYATVYPVSIFLRVISAQILILLLG